MNQCRSPRFLACSAALVAAFCTTSASAQNASSATASADAWPSRPITLVVNGGAGSLRVIAGDYHGHRGPARTFTPMQVWDMQLKSGKPVLVEFETQLSPARQVNLISDEYGNYEVNGKVFFVDGRFGKITEIG